MNNTEYLKKYDVVLFVIEQLRKENNGLIDICYCAEKGGFAYCWNETAALFSFFVWCVSVECYKRGFNIFKSLDKNDMTNSKTNGQRFNYFFPVDCVLITSKTNEKRLNKKIDRKVLQQIKQGYRPKNANLIEKTIIKALQKFFI